MVLDTVWRFLATNNLRFFLSLNTLYYWPYQEYIIYADNINDEGEWDIRVGKPVNQFYHPEKYNVIAFEQPHFDILLAMICPYTTLLRGEVGMATNRAEYLGGDDEQTRYEVTMADLLIEASDRWRETA